MTRRHFVVDDAVRAAHKRDAQTTTPRMHLFVPKENPHALIADGMDGTLLCGATIPVAGLPLDEAIFHGDVRDELSRILWENFPNRCSECVLRDKAHQQ